MSQRVRSTVVIALAAALLAAAGVWGALMVRADARHTSSVGDPTDYGPLSAQEYAAGVAAAQRQLTSAKAHLTSATAIIGNAACGSSDHNVKVLLLGRFPHAQVLPPPGGKSGPVTAALLAVDPATGKACHTSAGLGRRHPYRHAADLMPALKSR
jgi:hypothetical protein